MIVVDASVVVDVLLDTPPVAARAAAEILRHDSQPWAPHLVDAEVGQVLRRFVRARQVSVERAEGAIADLASMPLGRYPHPPLMSAAFRLRDRLSFYDALYVALAEALAAPLLTRDAGLARTARAQGVDVISVGGR